MRVDQKRLQAILIRTASRIFYCFTNCQKQGSLLDLNFIHFFPENSSSNKAYNLELGQDEKYMNQHDPKITSNKQVFEGNNFDGKSYYFKYFRQTTHSDQIVLLLRYRSQDKDFFSEKVVLSCMFNSLAKHTAFGLLDSIESQFYLYACIRNFNLSKIILFTSKK